MKGLLPKLELLPQFILFFGAFEISFFLLLIFSLLFLTLLEKEKSPAHWWTNLGLRLIPNLFFTKKKLSLFGKSKMKKSVTPKRMTESLFERSRPLVSENLPVWHEAQTGAQCLTLTLNFILNCRILVLNRHIKVPFNTCARPCILPYFLL